MSTALRRLQHTFAAAVTAPAAPRRRFGARGRTSIYRFAYRERLVGVLAHDHAGLHRLLGERTFRRLALAYVASRPSRHPNLNRFTARVPAFVARTQVSVPSRAFATDLARLEGAMVAAFDAEERAPLAPQELAAAAHAGHARVRLDVHPSVRFLCLRYSADEWLDAHQAGRRARPPRPRRTWVLVHRHAFVVRRLSLSRREHAVLRALAAGEPLTRALRHARAADPVAEWFQRWASAGLFTAIR